MKDGTCQAGDVAIITPYKAQQQYIERNLCFQDFVFNLFPVPMGEIRLPV